MFVHSVYFWLKDDLSEDNQAEFFAGVNSLTEISSVKQSFVGTPADTDRPIIDRSYSYSLILMFKDKAAHDAYQVDPIHDRFRENCESYWSKVVIYDATD